MFATYNFYHEYVSASGVHDSLPTDINAQMTHGKVLNVSLSAVESLKP